jgi:hypothetical protein
MKRLSCFCFSVCCIVLFGCSSSYFIKYDTYLPNSDPSKTLQFKDDKFDFTFLPRENGIWFTIKNITNKPAILEWDRCYFVDPSGNSSKALNVDLLEGNKETEEKAKYESMIPSNGNFSRFTTSARNVDIFKKISVTEMKGFLFSMEYSNVNVNIEKFTNFGRYWPEYKPVISNNNSSPTSEGTSTELTRIRNFVLNNNNLGLGFGIKLNDTILDYKFDFKFKSVEIFKGSKESPDFQSYIKGNFKDWESGSKIRATEIEGWDWK